MEKMLTIPEFGILSGDKVAGYTFQTDKGRYTLIYGMVELSKPFTYVDLYTSTVVPEQEIENDS